MSFQLNINAIDATGQPVAGAIIECYVLDRNLVQCPFEPKIKQQTNFYDGAITFEAAMNPDPAKPVHPGPYYVYGTVQAPNMNLSYFPKDGGFGVPWDGLSTLNIEVPVNPKSAVGPLPAPPSREDVLNVRAGFCNHTVDLATYGGVIPWFDPYIDCLSPTDRRTVYARKHELNYRHLVAGLGPQYAGYVVNSTYRDLREDIPTFAGVIRSIVVEGGLIPIVSFTYGGQDDWHFWHDNDGARLRAAVEVFRQAGLIPYCLFAILWELVDSSGGGDWTADQINTAITLWRDALGPDAHLAMELGQGYCHWGGGPGDLDGPIGLMLDAFFYEAQQPVLDNPDNLVRNEECTTRLLGPAAQNYDPKNAGPWYMALPNVRGPRTAVWFESCAYVYLHFNAPDSQVLAINEWAGFRGWSCYGNGPVS